MEMEEDRGVGGVERNSLHVTLPRFRPPVFCISANATFPKDQASLLFKCFAILKGTLQLEQSRDYQCKVQYLLVAFYRRLKNTLHPSPANDPTRER